MNYVIKGNNSLTDGHVLDLSSGGYVLVKNIYNKCEFQMDLMIV